MRVASCDTQCSRIHSNVWPYKTIGEMCTTDYVMRFSICDMASQRAPNYSNERFLGVESKMVWWHSWFISYQLLVLRHELLVFVHNVVQLSQFNFYQPTTFKIHHDAIHSTVPLPPAPSSSIAVHKSRRLPTHAPQRRTWTSAPEYQDQL